MNEFFTDFHEDSSWRRHQEELDAMPNRGEMPPVGSGPARCLKCGHGIELSKHNGVVLYFDPGTETLHVCKPRPKRIDYHEFKYQERQKTTLKVGGKRIEISR